MKVSKKLSLCASVLLLNSTVLSAAERLFPSWTTRSAAVRRICVASVPANQFHLATLNSVGAKRYAKDHTPHSSRSLIEGQKSLKGSDAWKGVYHNVAWFEGSLERIRDLLGDIQAVVMEWPQENISSKNSPIPPLNLENLTQGSFQTAQDKRRQHHSKNNTSPQLFIADGLSKNADLIPTNRKPALIIPVHAREPNKNSFHSESKLAQVSDLESLQTSRSQSMVEPCMTKANLMRGLLESKKSTQDVHNIINKFRTDFINMIRSAARDSQKVSQQDINDLLEIYASLAHRPKDGITKVLLGQTDTPKSAIYNDVLRHARLKQSSLETFRSTYANLSKAFGRNAMQVIYEIADKLIHERNFMVSFRSNGSGTSPQECLSYIAIGSNPLYPVTTEEASKIMLLYSTLKTRPKDSITKVLTGQTDTPKSAIYSDVFKHLGSKSELEILRSIYARLCKSLNGQAMQVIYALIDEKSKPYLSFKGMKELDLIPYEAITDRSSVAPRSHPETAPVIPDRGHVEMATPRAQRPNETQTLSSGKYSISTKELDLLTRVYSLLPEYHGNSVTGVLSGSTQNKKLPVWKSVLEVIDKIRDEEREAGNMDPLDLDYFRKLHWASIRVTGKSGLINTQTTEKNGDKKSKGSYQSKTEQRSSVKVKKK